MLFASLLAFSLQCAVRYDPEGEQLPELSGVCVAGINNGTRQSDTPTSTALRVDLIASVIGLLLGDCPNRSVHCSQLLWVIQVR